MATNQLSDTMYTPPVKPDVSKAAYDALTPSTDGYNYKPGYSPLGRTLGWWFNARKNRNYEQWKQNLLNQYDQDLAAWQTWLSSPTGQKTAYADAGYNTNYADPSSMSAASPIGSEYNEPEVAGQNIMSVFERIFSTVQGIQALQKGALDIQHQEIENKWADKLLGTQHSNLWSKGILTSQQTQIAQMQYAKLLSTMFAPEDIERVNQLLHDGTLFDPAYYPSGWSLSDAFARGPYAKGLDLDNKKIDEMIESLGLKNAIDEPIADMAGANAGLRIFGSFGMGLLRLLIAATLHK